MGADERKGHLPAIARPGRAGRRVGLRLRLGGRAPLPGGVLSLVRAGDLPRRRQPAHAPDPPGPRHRADAARLQPPGAHRRAHRDAGPRLERTRRLRHWRIVVGDGDGRPSASSREDKREQWEESLRCLDRHVPRRALGASKASTSISPSATSSPSRCRSRTRRCGSPAPTRTPSTWRRSTAWAHWDFDFSGPVETAKRRAEYYRIIREECEPIGDAVNAQYAVVSGFMCCPRDDEAAAKGLPGMAFFSYALSHYYAGTKHDPGNTDLMDAFSSATRVEFRRQRRRLHRLARRRSANA